ncbi:hypothetical protein DSO57_1037719 [Entomophthora muscae]|uniref:Uncharacterized protein n=1 Tax=Entomophthora muscae TaxID=34485 RepID=A0ACC2SNB1_9FUNG|nr:hypothetical protein DSO57_1037719 [Entomophthora muscae]
MFLQENRESRHLLSGASDGELRLWKILTTTGPKKPKVGAPDRFSPAPFSKINDFIQVGDALAISGVARDTTDMGQFGLFTLSN